MNKNIKNIILFVAIGVILVLVYIFFIKKDNIDSNLTTTNANPLNTATINTIVAETIDSQLSKDILATLSSVKNITLDDSIFSSNAFLSLIDGNVPLVPDGNEGRPNPFAPIGADSNSVIINQSNPVSETSVPELEIVPNINNKTN